MDILALLNPGPVPQDESSGRTETTPLASTTNDESSSDYSPEASISRRRKPQPRVAKVGPKLEWAMPLGAVRYPPHTADSEALRHAHERFHIFPYGRIAEYPRRIPYKSHKMRFLRATGREAFDVFQYTFRELDKGKEWTVMWDYNNGLVRITPFFKCLGYAKTTPAKAIGMNAGLTDVCYSITGGSLAAQGYWMPFDAAKALATTFCWEIRHALTPMFGNDFAELCTAPEDPAFKRFTIHQAIIERSREQFLSLSRTSNNSSTSRATSAKASKEVSVRPPAVDRPIRMKTERSGRNGSREAVDQEDTEMVDTNEWEPLQVSPSMSTASSRCTSRLPTRSCSPHSGSPFNARASQPISYSQSMGFPAATRRLLEFDFYQYPSSATFEETDIGHVKQRRVGIYHHDETTAAYALLLLRYGRDYFHPHV